MQWQLVIVRVQVHAIILALYTSVTFILLKDCHSFTNATSCLVHVNVSDVCLYVNKGWVHRRCGMITDHWSLMGWL